MRKVLVAATAAFVAAGGTLGASPRTAKHAPAGPAVSAQRTTETKNASPASFAAMRIQLLLRQAALLRAQNDAVTAVPTAEPRATRARVLRGDDAASSSRLEATPAPQTTDPTEAAGASTTATLVPGPVTDAVAHICGNVTICGVWWPGAVGDRGGYQSCMLHSTAAAAADLDFGTSPGEYCSSLYGGDCDDAGPGSELAELCSLVPGVAAQWSPDYAFSRIVTSGDCARYNTVALPEKNVLGLRLDAAAALATKAPAGAPPHLTICTAKLYLRVTQ